MDDKGYVFEDNGNFKVKSRTYPVTYKYENGLELKGSEKQVVYWSRKFYEKEYSEKKSFYDFIQKLIDSPDTYRITKVEAGRALHDAFSEYTKNKKERN